MEEIDGLDARLTEQVAQRAEELAASGSDFDNAPTELTDRFGQDAEEVADRLVHIVRADLQKRHLNEAGVRERLSWSAAMTSLAISVYLPAQ